MQDLTPVGLSQDGQRLVLVGASGEEYAVPVDARLRAALRGEKSRPAQLEMKMDSALRPRDIQTRIRAGESPEDVAAAAGTSVDGIMAFAGPVLAERAHVAATAQRASVRRRTGETTTAARTLGDTAEVYFAEHGLHDEDVEWDAWRRPDGRWALVATYAADGEPVTAEFTHDLPGRYVVAENDHARVLTGELHAPGVPASPASVRRLSTVRDEDELPLGDDAIELVRDRPAAEAPSTPVEEAPAPTSPARAQVSDTEDTAPVDMDPLPFDPAADTADADWLVRDRRAEEPTPVEPPTQDTPVDPAEAVDEVEAADSSLPSTEDQPLEGTEVAARETTAPRETPAPAKKKGRSSVPSWDEIMFGGGDKD